MRLNQPPYYYTKCLKGVLSKVVEQRHLRTPKLLYECIGSNYKDEKDLILARLKDVLSWCQMEINVKCIVGEYGTAKWMERYVNVEIPNAYLYDDRLHFLLSRYNVPEPTSDMKYTCEHFFKFMNFPEQAWTEYIEDEDIKKLMKKVRKEVTIKCKKIYKLLPKKKVVSIQIDFDKLYGIEQKEIVEKRELMFN